MKNAIEKLAHNADEKSGKQIIEFFAIAAAIHAMNGKVEYLNVIRECIDGKPGSKGKKSKPLKIEVVYKEKKIKKDGSPS